MKKLILPAICVFSLTIFSFKGKSEKAFELQEDGNYLIIDGSKISSIDQELLISQTKYYKGTKNFTSMRVISESAISHVFTSMITKKERDGDSIKKDIVSTPCPSPNLLVLNIIEKYNK